MSRGWWARDPAESEQEWANRIEEHNPSEQDEVRAANIRARQAKHAAREGGPQ